MTGRGKRRLALGAAAVLLAVLPGLDARLIVREYAVLSPRIAAPLRLALITDFHGCDYGPGQGELMDPLRAAKPDLVLLGGDLFDDGLPWDHTLELVRLLSAEYPCYYVSGNHEFRSGRAGAAKRILAAAGVTVLAGDCVTATVKGQTISISGVDDPEAGGSYAGQLESAAPAGEHFSLLLAHRPERVEEYLPYGYDLVLTGHAHGGQWRIPGLMNGFIAPNQGFFPDRAGGLYSYGGTTLVVSRGLARESTRIPRFYNRPELVLVTLTPQAAGSW